MPAPLFSVNGASEALERDRRTIVKALRHTKPDGKQHGQPRWRLKTIMDALDQLPGSRNANVSPIPVHHNWLDPKNWRDSRVAAALVAFNEAFAEMEAISDMAKRRQFAQAKLGPLIAFHDKHFREWETDNAAPGKFANDDVSVSCRVELLWHQELDPVQSACGWDSEEGRKFLVDPFYDYGEEE